MTLTTNDSQKIISAPCNDGTQVNVHGGNLRVISEQSGLDAGKIIDFSANINPYGPIPGLSSVLNSITDDILHYPDPENTELISAICTAFGYDRSMVTAGNGASELLYAAARLSLCKRALIPVPSYSDYARAAEMAGLPVNYFFCKESDNFIPDLNILIDTILPGDIVFLGSPNNPNGLSPDTGSLYNLITARIDSLFVIDESFIEFSNNHSIAERLPQNAVMVRSMTKFYAIPGLRLGYSVSAPHIAEEMRQLMIPWNINCFAAKAGTESLRNIHYQNDTRLRLRETKASFFNSLLSFPQIHVFPSECNFFLIKLKNSLHGTELYNMLLKHKIAIRTCVNFKGLDDSFIRIAIRTDNENAYFIDALREIFRDLHI